MKILSIDLENFASHIHSRVDLSHIISATVSGKNGSGKSTAFVDAPLWALFGKCRADADSIMAHDQLRMTVTLHFSLDGQEYYVQRTRSKATRAGKTELAFFAKNNNSWVAIGGHKVSETQEAIKNVLNADYDLMANSNFLIQGHADRFSVASPAERKSILSQVLRLDEYVALKSITSRKVSVVGELIAGKAQQMNPLELQVNGIMSLKANIKKAESDLEDCSAKQLDHNLKSKEYWGLKGKKQGQLNEILKGKEGLDKLCKETSALQSKLRLNLLDQELFQKLISRKVQIETAEAEYAAILQTLSLGKEKDVSIMKELIDIEGLILQASERKSREVETLTRVESELQGLQHRKEMIESQKQVELEKLQREITDCNEQQKLLEAVPCWKELQEKCMFTVKAIAAKEILPTKLPRLQAVEGRDFLKEQLPDYDKDYQTRLDQIKNLKLTPIDQRRDELEVQKKAIQDKKAEHGKQMEPLEKQLAVVEPLARLKPGLDSALKEKGLLAEAYEQGSGFLHELKNQIQIKTLMQDEEDALANWLTKSLDTEDYLKNQESFFAGEIRGITERLARLRLECEQAELSRGKLAELIEQLAELGNNHSALKQLHTYYQTIPVMIMEGAVPTLEAATNSILEKISPSGMRVRLETQKALKTTDRLGETLDILVRDVFGEKPYENYSGGEKFRLDLALRFGLSQLLMHRAGSKLETLIIDEGLGSLDGDGLSLLRECLSKLETSFGLILIISHVEEIQGTFEQQIMVKKNATGSEIEIL